MQKNEKLNHTDRVPPRLAFFLMQCIANPKLHVQLNDLARSKFAESGQASVVDQLREAFVVAKPHLEKSDSVVQNAEIYRRRRSDEMDGGTIDVSLESDPGSSDLTELDRLGLIIYTNGFIGDSTLIGFMKTTITV